MFRTPPRRTHRAEGPAVIDYRGLTAPVGRTVGGVAVIGAVSAVGALQDAGSPAIAAPAPAVGPSAAPATVTVPTIAPATPSAFSSVTLRQGARGAAVTSLQESLRSHGASITADGVFGPKTLSAVRSFQGSAGLRVDGVVGTQTWGALGSGSGSTGSTAPSAPSVPSSQPLLRQGDRGASVRTLQQNLNSAGASLGVDGVFGAGTASAVRSLQGAAGISRDAVVGPKTWNALSSGVRITGGTADRDADRTPVTSRFDGQAIVNAARGQIGTRYTWGGSTPSSGFDCSGLVYHAYKQAGIDLPRKTAKGYTFGGRIIPASQAQVGDLVAFTGNDYGHIGIYAGNGTIVDSSGSRQRVMERSIWNAPHVYVTYR